MTRHHIIAAAIAIAVGSAAIADARPGGRDAQRGPRGEIGAFAQELNLTENQRAALQSMREDMRERMDDIRTQVQAGDLGREEARSQAQAIREEMRPERQSIFTAEQLQLIEAHRAEVHEAREARPGAGGGPLGQLDLTDAQKEQLQSMREGHHNAAQALRESGEATREDFEQLRDQHREQVGSVLTDEQRQQLEELRAQRELDGEGKCGRGFRGRGRGSHGRRLQGFLPPPGDPPPGGEVADAGPVVTESAATAAPTAVTGVSWGSVKAEAAR